MPIEFFRRIAIKNPIAMINKESNFSFFFIASVSSYLDVSVGANKIHTPMQKISAKKAVIVR